MENKIIEKTKETERKLKHLLMELGLINLILVAIILLMLIASVVYNVIV